MIKKWLLLLPLMATATLFAITPKIEANTFEYQLSHLQGQAYAHNTGSLVSFATAYYTPKIEIINNTIIINDISLVGSINFWNNNTYIGYQTNFNGATNPSKISSHTETIVIPQNATHFSIWYSYSSNDWGGTGKTFSQFQTITVSYEAPATGPTMPETVTSPTSINFIDNEAIDISDGSIVSDSLMSRTDLINISALNTWQWENDNVSTGYHMTHYYDANKDYIGTILENGFDLYTDVSTNTKPAYAKLPSGRSTFEANAEYIIITAIKGDQQNQPPYLSDYQIYSISPVTFTDFQANQINSNIVKISYANYLGQIISEYYIEIGSDLTNLDNQESNNVNFAREGYTLTGWSAPYVAGSTDAIKTPLYNQIPTYTVTFENYDGTVLGTDTVQQGESATAPVVPARTGYNFVGWLPPIADIQGNITTVAQYEAIEYLVEWQQNGNVIQSNMVEYGSLLPTPPDSQDPLRTIIGWHDYFDLDWDGETSIDLTTFTVTGPLTLSSINQLESNYSITWRDPSFNTIAITNVASGVTPTPPSYDPGSGFQLIGWNPTIQPATENTTYIAQVDSLPETSGTTIIYRTQLPDDYNGLTDLFGGVFGGIIGLVMTLGTIDLFGIQLSAIIYLFISASLGLTIFKMIRG